MKYFTNKITSQVFGYTSVEVAQQYNDDFDNLVEMTDEQSQILKGAELTNGNAEGIINAVKDLLAFIDKLPKE